MPETDIRLTCEQADDRVLIAAVGARVVFLRDGDRWTHHMDLPGGGSEPDSAPVPLIATVETPSDHDDPSRVLSPVYQELHRHDLGGEGLGVCLLLTGLFHLHHFSASVVCRVDPATGQFEVDFDVADRCRTPVSALAATYLVRLGSSDLADAGPRRVAWELADPAPGLELAADPPVALALAEAGRRASRVQVLAAIDPVGFTHRIRYRWRWCSSSGLASEANSGRSR